MSYLGRRLLFLSVSKPQALIKSIPAAVAQQLKQIALA